MKPVIAITIKTEDIRNRPQITLPEAYIKAIEDGGGIPIIIPIMEQKTNIPSVARFVDGFLFSGGDDIRPGYYGEEQLLNLTLSPDERTDFEIALFKEALQLKKPVLGICLGAQLINVALGGSLYQDIPTQIHAPLDHRSAHHVSLSEGSLLYRILIQGIFNRQTLQAGHGSAGAIAGPGREISIISAHHQAVKSPGKDLVVSASSQDGVIEAIEMPDHPFLIGVQWHPERTLEDIYTKRLFQAFIKMTTEISDRNYKQ